MSNPNWPQFPGVPNMVTDDKGRPSVLDLVPGKQEGTPLEKSFFDPIIHGLCDVTDGVDNAVSGVFGKSGGDVQINGFFLQNSSDLPCIVYKNPQGGYLYENLISSSSLETTLRSYQPAGDYAARSDLQAETARAQAAEATRVSSITASGDDTIVTDIVWNHTYNKLATQLPDKSWKFLYPQESTVQALTYSNADARPTTIRVLKKSYNGTPQLIVQNDGAPDFVGASLDHVSTVVNAETSRAQAAEATKIPTIPASNNDTAVTNIVWNHTGNQLATQLPDYSWRYFYPQENSIRTPVLSDADARINAMRVQKSGYCGHPQIDVDCDNYQSVFLPTTDGVDSAINAETARAQAAEARTIKTQSNNTDHPVDLVVYNDPGQTLAAHDSQTGLWKYFNTTDNSVRTVTLSDADVKPTTIRVFKNEGNNGQPQLILQNNGFRDFVGPSLDYVNQEISRAQAAESKLLPLSGGTISGTISTASGGVVPEISQRNQPQIIQAFKAHVWDGNTVNFPIPFSGVPFVQATCHPGGGWFGATLATIGNITATSVTIGVVTLDQGTTEGGADIEIIAIGPK